MVFAFYRGCRLKKRYIVIINILIEPNHALARDSFPYILSTADAVLFFCYNSRKPA